MMILHFGGVKYGGVYTLIFAIVKGFKALIKQGIYFV
jgi:hypothetical protein